MKQVTSEKMIELVPAVALFKSLGDPVRLRILQRLSSGEARVIDLTDELGLAQSTISAHVSCLRECALIEGRSQGRQVFYRVNQPGLLKLLRAGEHLLEATNHKIALCPKYGNKEIHHE